MHFQALRFQNFLGKHAPRGKRPYGPFIISYAYLRMAICLLKILLKPLIVISSFPDRYKARPKFFGKQSCKGKKLEGHTYFIANEM